MDSNVSLTNFICPGLHTVLLITGPLAGMCFQQSTQHITEIVIFHLQTVPHHTTLDSIHPREYLPQVGDCNALEVTISANIALMSIFLEILSVLWAIGSTWKTQSYGLWKYLEWLPLPVCQQFLDSITYSWVAEMSLCINALLSGKIAKLYYCNAKKFPQFFFF